LIPKYCLKDWRRNAASFGSDLAPKTNAPYGIKDLALFDILIVKITPGLKKLYV
jgi:hypothetical protein